MKSSIVLAFVFLSSLAFASETITGAKKDLEVFKQDMSKELSKAESNLKALKEKALDKSSASYKEALKDLTNKRDELRVSIKELEVDSKGTWKETKSRLSKSLDGLNERIQKALKEE